VIARGLDPATTRVDAVMTPDPVTIAPSDPFGRALVIMNEKGFRHLPVVEAGRVVGMVSSRAALDPKLEEFRSEAERRRYFAK
jgi:CBS domain-containing protein